MQQEEQGLQLTGRANRHASGTSGAIRASTEDMGNATHVASSRSAAQLDHTARVQRHSRWTVVLVGVTLLLLVFLLVAIPADTMAYLGCHMLVPILLGTTEARP
ncbi:hypothetical protein ABBQ32_005215 [Trebouxia sp. C0010 RCD-2024]